MNPKLIRGVKVSERTQKQRQDKSCNNQLLRSVIIIKVYLEKNDALLYCQYPGQKFIFSIF